MDRNMRTKKILLVEDDTLIRNVLRIVLERMGHRVVEAPDGERGLEVARAFHGKIDLVISDVKTPRMDGPELVRTLLMERPGIKVLLMSGYSPESLPRDLREDFLRKPFPPAAIKAKVGEVLAREN
jgi:two-component system, cell cycle sensor histidine kinase and response regulator CckA